MSKKKGKALQGRAKQKQKAQKNGPAGSWTNNHKFPKLNRHLLDPDDEDDESYQGFRGFAQSQPQANFSPRSFNVSLRHQAIAFVSAGVNPSSIDRPPKTSEELVLDAEGDDHVAESASVSDSSDFDIDDSAIQTNIVMDTDLEVSESGIAKMTIGSSSETIDIDDKDYAQAPSGAEPVTSVDASESMLFMVDTVGDAELGGRFKSSKQLSHTPRAPSPAPSNSSEEVVLFHGRNKNPSKPRVVEDPVTQSLSNQTPIQPVSRTQPHVTDDLLRALETHDNSDPPTPTPSSRQQYLSGNHPLPGEWAPAPSEPYWRKSKKNGKAHTKLDPSPDEGERLRGKSNQQAKDQSVRPSRRAEDDDAETTIATLQADWKDVLRAKKLAATTDFPRHDIEEKIKPSKRRGKRGRKKSNRNLLNNLSSDDDDPDGEAAYDDYMANLAAQMDEEDEADEGGNEQSALKASIPSFSLGGPSLVVDGREIADDEVLPKHLKLEGDTDDDGSQWESDTGPSPDSDELSGNDSLDATDLEDELEYTEKQQWEDEDDLRQRRLDGMTDEHLARLFAKQQELGYDGDDLILDDGAEMISDEYGDVAAARAGLSQFSDLLAGSGKKKAGKRRGGKRHETSFPDATAFAETLDQYGEHGFDIMDFDRPSLRPTKKGRKGQLPPEIEMLSDEDLKESLQSAWGHDRDKKRQKKLEREALRADGMLGSGGKRRQADLSERYTQGMTMAQVHDELKAFLLDDDAAERAFPPMEKRDRKALHEIAVALQLTSKSRGAGKTRFPILYKTSRTVEYSDDLFDRILQASSRGFLTNRGKATKFAKNMVRESKRAGRGGFDKSAVTVRNGELVGAGAAEIGRENFGHRLLEKMGWTKGQALGKDGEGLLVPVEQRMRVGTAGLG